MSVVNSKNTSFNRKIITLIRFEKKGAIVEMVPFALTHTLTYIYIYAYTVIIYIRTHTHTYIHIYIFNGEIMGS